MKWRSVIIGLYIKTFNPQIIHINELQRAGYSLAHVKNIKKNKKSRLIIASSWGSDLVLFSQIDTHKIDLQNILAITDLLTAEREVELDYARDLGFSGNFISPIYNTIGLSHTYKNPSLCSTRRIILIKGYQNFAGRALNSLNAIERCSDILEGYKILVYSSSADTKIEVELLRKRSGLDIWTLENASKQDFLNYFALARLYIGLSISDGLSTSMVEAMSAGALPIQSKNSAAFDFLENGVNGFIVDPWDLENLESCIRRVISDDQLVNQAQILNRDVINNQYNYQDNLLKLRAIYESVL
jgi:glycosyltransferase involved in cell wall biosynthesis